VTGGLWIRVEKGYYMCYIELRSGRKPCGSPLILAYYVGWDSRGVGDVFPISSICTPCWQG
jgi:hypothetical protein